MSVFDKDIIKNESDIEALRKMEAYYNAIHNAILDAIDKKGKNASAYYIMCNEEASEAFVRQYPNS